MDEFGCQLYVPERPWKWLIRGHSTMRLDGLKWLIVHIYLPFQAREISGHLGWSGWGSFLSKHTTPLSCRHIFKNRVLTSQQTWSKPSNSVLSHLLPTNQRVVPLSNIVIKSCFIWEWRELSRNEIISIKKDLSEGRLNVQLDNILPNSSFGKSWDKKQQPIFCSCCFLTRCPNQL